MTPPLMIFAAGFGTRMGALTAETPKPLVELGGRPLIDHVLSRAREARVPRIVANAHYRAGMIEAHLAPLGVEVVTEAPRLLDTGGGLKAALPRLSASPVLTANSDAVWTGANPFETLQAAWDPGRMDALLLVCPAARAVGREGPGDFALHPDGRLARGGDLVFTGAQMLAPERVEEIEAEVFSLNLLWDRLIAEGRLHGVAHPGRWADVGHPGGLAEAERMLADV